MTEIKALTCEDFLEEIFPLVHSDVVDTWRWGTIREEVVHREEDNTYWRATYRVSTDGETNELREGLADIEQVQPETQTTTVYKRV